MIGGFLLLMLCVAVGGLAGVDPGLAIVASLGLVFVVLAFMNLTAGLALFALMIFLEALFRGGGFVSFTKLAGLLLAISWLAKLATTNRERINLLLSSHPHASYLLLAFVAWVALGATWAVNSGDVLTDASRFLLNFTLFAIIFTAIRGRVELGWLLAAFIAGVAITALYGLVVRPVEDPRKVDRVASTVGNPNELAAVLVAGMTLATGAALALRGSALRAPAAVIAGLTLATLILTGSRGGVIALSVTLLAAVIFAGRWRGPMLALVAVLAMAAVGFFFTLTPQAIQDRLLSVTPGELRASQEARGTIWQVGLRVSAENLATGVGSSNFNDVSINYVFDTPGAARSDQIFDEAKTMHNMYLQALVETGVLGLILFLAILLFILRTCWQAARLFGRNGDIRMEILSRAALVAMIGVMAAGFFSSHQFAKWLWFLFALGPVLLSLARRESGAEQLADAPPDVQPARRPSIAPAG